MHALKPLFEIPIYSMTESEFNRRWSRRKKRFYDLVFSHSKENNESKSRIKSMFYPRDLWRFNQIIGYIVISASDTDIWIELYKSLATRFYATRKQKHYIQNMNLSGMHFRAENMCNSEIRLRFREALKEIEDSHVKSTMYIDYCVFNNLIESIDFKKILVLG